MEMTRRTQADRSAATRSALISAARTLFAEHGYAGVGTETITATAQVSRGALYHQFGDKAELFAATFVAIEKEITERIAAAGLVSSDAGVAPMMMSALNVWLDECEAPEVQRIVLLDGPSVLGWARWRELCQPYVLSLVEALLEQAVEQGAVQGLPTRPLAHAMVAVADEAAMYIVAADDKAAARRDMVAVLEHILNSVTSASQS